MRNTNYIIGIGRSGTSLLMSLLGSHPEIHTPPENYFSVFFAHSFSKKNRFSKEDIALIDRFNIAFGKLQPYVGFHYQLSESTRQNGFNGNYMELCKEIYSSFQHVSFIDKNPIIFIDKNPSNTLFLPKIKQLNPDAKYIIMLRDYRGNILSRKESIHLLSPNIAFNAIRWSYFTQKALNWKKKHPTQVLLLRYEDLVVNPEKCLTEVFSFLGVNPLLSKELQRKERLGYETYKNDTSTEKSERAKKKYEDLAQPIFHHRVEKWRDNLTQEEIRTAEAFCANLGTKFGYLPEQKNTKITTFLIRLKHLLLQVKTHLTFQKDYLFYYLPIRYKVSRFEQYVGKIDKKRKLNS